MKTESGEPLSEWSKANALELNATGNGGPEPVYTEFRWVR